MDLLRSTHTGWNGLPVAGRHWDRPPGRDRDRGGVSPTDTTVHKREDSSLSLDEGSFKVSDPGKGRGSVVEEIRFFFFREVCTRIRSKGTDIHRADR